MLSALISESLSKVLPWWKTTKAIIKSTIRWTSTFFQIIHTIIHCMVQITTPSTKLEKSFEFELHLCVLSMINQCGFFWQGSHSVHVYPYSQERVLVSSRAKVYLDNCPEESSNGSRHLFCLSKNWDFVDLNPERDRDQQ